MGSPLLIYNIQKITNDTPIKYTQGLWFLIMNEKRTKKYSFAFKGWVNQKIVQICWYVCIYFLNFKIISCSFRTCTAMNISENDINFVLGIYVRFLNSNTEFILFLFKNGGTGPPDLIYRSQNGLRNTMDILPPPLYRGLLSRPWGMDSLLSKSWIYLS